MNNPQKKKYCETHRWDLAFCAYIDRHDESCMVCGCGGLCDSTERCPMARKATMADRDDAIWYHLQRLPDAPTMRPVVTEDRKYR